MAANFFPFDHANINSRKKSLVSALRQTGYGATSAGSAQV